MKRLFLLAALAFAAPIYSQTLTFTVETTSANGTSVVPRLTWSATPAGASCTATSTPATPNWTGSKAVSGTQLMPAITATNGYSMTCNWPGVSVLRVWWDAPTLNADGTPYDNPGGYRIQYGRTAVDLDNSVYIQDPAARTWTSPTGLAAGNYYLGVRAYNVLGLESPLTLSTSNPHVITVGATQTRNVEVAIKFPAAPVGVRGTP
jgi:hypothetical protein